MKFNWLHVLCVGFIATCLSGPANASRLSDIKKDVRNKICIGIDASKRPVFSTRYDKAKVNTNFEQAKCDFLGKYGKIRKNLRFNSAEGQKLAIRHYNDLLEVYKREVLKKVNEPEISSTCLGFSVILENILTECGIENYTLSIGGPAEKDTHAANLYKLNDKWYIADVTADVCGRSYSPSTDVGRKVESVHYLQMPLAEYRKVLEDLFGFTKGVLIGVNVGLDSEVTLRNGNVLPLEAFMQFYRSSDIKL